MQPSSLVFVVVVVAWAAYVAMHWARRREELATARTMDRFTETMRVLDHRSALAGADDGRVVHRSYVGSPARAAAPTRPTEAVPVPMPAHQSESFVTAGPRPPRAVRGVTFLVALAAVVLSPLLAAFGVVQWWVVPVALVALAGSVVWLRMAVVAERAARRERRRLARERRSVGTRSADAGRRVVRPAAPAPRRVARPADLPTASVEPTTEETSSDHEVTDTSPAADEVFDVARPVVVESDAPDVDTSVAADPGVVATETAGEVVVPVARLDEDDVPDTWDPRPVPRPTYTMKARAPQRPAVAPQVEELDAMLWQEQQAARLRAVND